MTDRYDELLKQGLIKLKEMEFSYVPEKEDIDHNFSDKYLSNKERLLNKLSRSYWKYVNTAAKKVAVIIISFIIAFSSLMTVDALRESLIDFIVTIYKSFAVIEHKIANNEYLENYYSLQKPPEGYTNILTNLDNSKFIQLWDFNGSNPISLAQVPLYTPNQFNSEHGKLSEETINNTPCLVCVDNTLYYCYWEFDGYRFELIYPIELGEEFMSEVVGHLVEVDPEEFKTE